MIRLFQLDRIWADIRATALENIDNAMGDGTAQNGRFTRNLENAILPALSDRRFALTVASGSDALVIALQALDLPFGSRVAVPTYSFFASAGSIVRCGLTPVIIDVDDNFLLDLNQVENVSAILAVDLLGQGMDYPALLSLGVPVVMDGAQSIETRNHGISSLKVGVISTTSFSPTKTIPVMGSGGAILTDDDDLARRCKLLRNHGKPDALSPAIQGGFNSRLSEMEAAQLTVCFDRHEHWHRRRQFIASTYQENLSDKYVLTSGDGTHTWHKFVIRTKRRDKLQSHLSKMNIESRIYYSPMLHQEPIMKEFAKGVYTNAEKLQGESLAIHVSHTLTDSELEKIIDALRDF